MEESGFAINGMYKGYLKIHVVAVDIKKKKIVTLDVTSEEVHDYGNRLKNLVDNALENNTLKKVISEIIPLRLAC